MALQRKTESDLDALLRQAIAEQRAVNAALFEPTQPHSEELIQELERDEEELVRTWDEMERVRGHLARRYTAEEIISQDRGE